MSDSFKLVPETCPQADAAYKSAQKAMENAFEDSYFQDDARKALQDMDDVNHALRLNLREALDNACDKIVELSKKPMTVRQAFTLAFGEVPDGATCHVGFFTTLPPDHVYTNRTLCPSLVVDSGELWIKSLDNCWSTPEGLSPIGNDISDLPAETFVVIGIFGERYDKAVRGELGV